MQSASLKKPSAYQLNIPLEDANGICGNIGTAIGEFNSMNGGKFRTNGNGLSIS